MREHWTLQMRIAARLRELYGEWTAEMAVFNWSTDQALIDASAYRLKAIDEQIKAARAALEAA